ncbi:TolB family protein [Chloroflexota bacterium]
MERGTLQAIGLFLVVVTLGLAGTAPVYAAAGAGPGDATTPPSDWQQHEAGVSHWYGFQYAGDSSQIEVRLQVVPEGGAAFEVWTPELIERWGLGYEVEPIGRGSVDPFSGRDLIWTGSFSTRGTYYVVITHAGDQPASSYYLLTVTGPGVFFSEPTPAATPQPVKSPAVKAATADITGRLVFQTSYGGTFYTIDVDGTELKPVTTGIDPVWSPNGDQIAFARSEEPRGVWVVDMETGDEWRAFDWSETRYPSFSPDASQIVFSRQHGGPEDRTSCRRGHCFTRPGNEHWRLGIVDAGTGDFYEPDTEKKDSRTPDWAPASAGSDLVVYHGEHGLVVESVDGGVAYQLTSTAKDTSPVWSPQGEQVAFVRRQHDHWEVYIVDAASGEETRLTNTPARPDGAAASSVSPAWSPAPLEGGTQQGQSATGAGHIAFLTDRSGEWEIWVMEADGSNQRPLFDSELDGLVLAYAFAGERAISWTQ